MLNGLCFSFGQVFGVFSNNVQKDRQVIRLGLDALSLKGVLRWINCIYGGMDGIRTGQASLAWLLSNIGTRQRQRLSLYIFFFLCCLLDF